MMTLTAAKVAKIIGIPEEEWPGNCYAVAASMVRHGVVKGEPRYGRYTGPVNEGCRIPAFRDQRTYLGHVQHGWIAQRDGTIIDPTRWCFLGWGRAFILVIEPDDPRQAEYATVPQSVAVLRRTHRNRRWLARWA